MSTEAPPAPAPITEAPPAAPQGQLLGGITPPAPTAVETPPAPASGLPDDVPYIFKAINANPDLKNYEKQLTAKFDKAKTPEELIAALGKSYSELEKHKGEMKFAPDTPEGYGLLSNEKLKSLGVDEKLAGEYAGIFHELNLSPEKANQLIEKHAEMVSKMGEAQKTAKHTQFQAAVEGLRAEHGQKFESVMREAQSVHDLAMAGAGLDAKEVGELLDNPAYSKLLIALSKRLSATPMIKGGMDSVIAGDNAKWQGMLRDPKSPINDPNHPDHSRTIDEYAGFKRSFGA